MRMTYSASAQLAGTLGRARAEADALFALLHPDAFYHRPIPERHRLIFYLGHLEAFDWNLLCRDRSRFAGCARRDRIRCP
jgi:iron(II)-dependent oxidoreductase